MSTVQTIITNGYAKSAAARPDSNASPTELIARVGQCLREVFQVWARENPLVLAVTGQVQFDGIGWARPTDALRIVQVRADIGTIAAPTIPAGTRIRVVPFDDPLVAAGKPCLTEMGQRFISTGQAVDPSAGTVTMVYARGPQQPTTVTDSVDPLFPSFFDDILQFDIALYLAMKDQREADVQLFTANKGALLKQSIEWTRGQTYDIVQRFPLISPPLTNENGGRQSGADA